MTVQGPVEKPQMDWMSHEGGLEKGALLSRMWILAISGQNNNGKTVSSKAGQMMILLTPLDALIPEMPFACFSFFLVPNRVSRDRQESPTPGGEGGGLEKEALTTPPSPWTNFAPAHGTYSPLVSRPETF